MSASKTNVYILRLEGGKYYVGKSDNPIKRYQEHLDGRGSSWTKKYKPVEVLKVIENVTAFDEDKYTKEYMAKYGIDNVRGGSYVTHELDDTQYEALEREIWAAKDCCTNCGRKGHFSKSCFASTDVNGNPIGYNDSDSDEYVWQCEYCHLEFESEKKCGMHEQICKYKIHSNCIKGSCFRCGREGHYADDCYATYHDKGYRLY